MMGLKLIKYPCRCQSDLSPHFIIYVKTYLYIGYLRCDHLLYRGDRLFRNLGSSKWKLGWDLGYFGNPQPQRYRCLLTSGLEVCSKVCRGLQRSVEIIITNQGQRKWQRKWQRMPNRWLAKVLPCPLAEILYGRICCTTPAFILFVVSFVPYIIVISPWAF